jgi:glycosyltransferase involved in cell wall biosynthesis
VDLLGSPIAPDEAATGYQLCERGISIASGDANGFASGLARLIDDEALRDSLGQLGLGFVTQNYSKERLLADVAHLYRDLAPADAGSADVPSG